MWGSYFDEIVRLLEGAERQYGIANQSYTEYVLERLEYCVQTCRNVRGQITPRDSAGRLEWYRAAFDDLILCLQSIRRKWEEYRDILGSGSPNGALPYQVPVVHTGMRGRPRFDVTREQLEYLASLSFSWIEIAALLGVSRTTIYRYVPTSPVIYVGDLWCRYPTSCSVNTAHGTGPVYHSWLSTTALLWSECCVYADSIHSDSSLFTAHNHFLVFVTLHPLHVLRLDSNELSWHL